MSGESTARDVIQIILADPTSQVAISGAAGGLVRSITLRERVVRSLGAVTVGSICAVYGSPLTLHVISPLLSGWLPQPGELERFAGFVTGIAAIVIVGWLLDFARDKLTRMQGGGQ